MRILVSNDDGFDAPGIHSLAKALRPLGEVTVVAPATQQTAKGHSLTIGSEIRVQKRFFEEGIPGYAVWGTPKDCVDLAVDALLEHRPDLGDHQEPDSQDRTRLGTPLGQDRDVDWS